MVSEFHRPARLMSNSVAPRVFRPRLSYEAPSVTASERIPADEDPCNLNGAVPVAKVAHPLLEEVALDAHEEVATRVNEPE